MLAMNRSPVRSILATQQTSALPRPVYLPMRVSDDVYSRMLILWLRGALYYEIAKASALTDRVVRACAETVDWMEAADRLRPRMQKEDKQVATRLAAIAARKLEERLIEGDEHVDMKGRIVMKAVGARDCAAIMEIAADRRDKTQRAIDGVPEPNSSSALEDLFRVATALIAGQMANGTPALPPPEKDVTPSPAALEAVAIIEAEVTP
jgi:hypothetical protein